MTQSLWNYAKKEEKLEDEPDAEKTGSGEGACTGSAKEPTQKLLSDDTIQKIQDQAREDADDYFSHHGGGGMSWDEKELKEIAENVLASEDSYQFMTTELGIDSNSEPAVDQYLIHYIEEFSEVLEHNSRVSDLEDLLTMGPIDGVEEREDLTPYDFAYLHEQAEAEVTAEEEKESKKIPKEIKQFQTITNEKENCR